MNQRYPQDESPEAIVGTAAHWVAWELLFNRPVSSGQVAPNGAIVTDEMLEGGDLLCDAVAERLYVADLRVERTVHIPQIHPDCYGTPDVWGISREDNTLHIIDYKFGHRFVDEYCNPQGLLYLLGILKTLNSDWEKNLHLNVQFTIVQPRCFVRGESVRSHSFVVRDMMPLFQELRASAELAVRNPIATTNPHCNDCPGRHACPALQEAAYSDAEFANDRQPHDLTPNAAGLELRMLERALARLEDRVDGLRELTLQNIRLGKNVSYYRAERTNPRQAWIATPGAVIAMGELFNLDLSKPGLVTPKQAMKMGIDEAVISGYSVTPTGSLKLVAENPKDAAKVFGR